MKNLKTCEDGTSVKARFLHNQRQALARVWSRESEAYSRRLSQYGENAVEPLYAAGGWTFGKKA